MSEEIRMFEAVQTARQSITRGASLPAAVHEAAKHYEVDENAVLRHVRAAQDGCARASRQVYDEQVDKLYHLRTGR